MKNQRLLFILAIIVSLFSVWYLVRTLYKSDQNVDSKVEVVEEATEIFDQPSAELVNYGIYTDYSEDKISLASSGKLVLFFTSNFCTKCKLLETDIEKGVVNMPSNVAILKINYDQNTELVSKYKLKSSHAFVQVNEKGDLVKVWYNSPKLESILKEII